MKREVECLPEEVVALLTPFFFLKSGLNISISAVVANWSWVLIFFALKFAAKLIGVYPPARRYAPRNAIEAIAKQGRHSMVSKSPLLWPWRILDSTVAYNHRFRVIEDRLSPPDRASFVYVSIERVGLYYQFAPALITDLPIAAWCASLVRWP